MDEHTARGTNANYVKCPEGRGWDENPGSLPRGRDNPPVSAADQANDWKGRNVAQERPSGRGGEPRPCHMDADLPPRPEGSGGAVPMTRGRRSPQQNRASAGWAPAGHRGHGASLRACIFPGARGIVSVTRTRCSIRNGKSLVENINRTYNNWQDTHS